MSRRSRSSEETFTLFPFLAVLLCTMGALTMIFVAIAQKGSDAPEADERSSASKQIELDPQTALGDAAQYGSTIDAKTLQASLSRNRLGEEAPVFSTLDEPCEEETSDAANANAKNDSDASSIDEEYERALIASNAMSLDDALSEQESIEWMLGEFRGIRERLDDSLEEQRARLTNAEAALARLRSELEIAQRKYELLCEEKQNVPENSEESPEDLRKKLDVLDKQIAEIVDEVKTLREKNKDVKKSYAIIPYQGKKGTFRRPIYIECNSEGVFLQPEGVRFYEGDFLLARYPGNPFDTAIRAAAQHYVQTIGTKTPSGDTLEPYPLLVVRPGGAKYFYFALSALTSWGDLYGYEFVAEDQQIEYPEPDPTLRSLVETQTRDSRVRLEQQLRQIVAVQNAVEQQYSLHGAPDAFGASGAGGSVPGINSELQSRFGSDVRFGAARIASGAPNGVPNSASGAAAAQGLGGTNGGGANGGYPNVSPALAANNAGSPVGSNPYGAWEPRYNGEFAKFMNGSNGAPDPNASGSGGANPSAAENGSSENGLVQSGSNENGSGENGLVQNGLVQNGSVQNGSGSVGAYASNAAQYAQTAQYAQNGSQTQYIPNASAAQEGTNTPNYMANFVSNANSAASADPSVDLSKTLGNTTYANNASGVSSEGSSTPKPSSDGASGPSTMLAMENKLDEPQKKDPRLLEKDGTPPNAFRPSIINPVDSGIERGVLVRCEPDGYVFPKQAGVRAASSIKRVGRMTEEQREQELMDSFTFCVRSWGAAGRNAYWAPFVKAEVAQGGEERFRELSEFCKKQGLSIVPVDANGTAK